MTLENIAGLTIRMWFYVFGRLFLTSNICIAGVEQGMFWIIISLKYRKVFTQRIVVENNDLRIVVVYFFIIKNQ